MQAKRKKENKNTKILK